MKMKLTFYLTAAQVKDAIKEYLANTTGMVYETATIENVEFDGRSLTHDMENCEVTIKQDKSSV